MSMATLTFTMGSSEGATQCLNVTVVDDDVVERVETFSVTMMEDDDGVRLGNSRSTITITDNECK